MQTEKRFCFRGFSTCNQNFRFAVHCVNREISEGEELTWDYGDEFRAALEKNHQKAATSKDVHQKAANVLYSLAGGTGASAGAGAEQSTAAVAAGPITQSKRNVIPRGFYNAREQVDTLIPY